MNLDQLQVKLRPRSHWQTIDLGMRVTLRHFKPLLALSFIMTTPLVLLLFAITQEAWSACLLLFWLKPIIERPLLFFISRSIFAEQISVAQVMEKLPTLLKTDGLATYGIGRISVSRSFNEPVRILEGLGGEQRKKRLEILHRDQSGPGWLTFFGIHVEMMIQGLIFALPFFLLPQDDMKNGFFDLIMEGAVFTETLTVISYAIAVALVAPFYVVCGFMLYLNRRTSLECWHIELGFKKMAQRLSPTLPLHLLLASLLLLPHLSSSPVQADIAEENSVATECSTEDCSDVQEKSDAEDEEKKYPKINSEEAEKIRTALQEVLNSDKFGEHYQEREYSVDWDKLFDWDWQWNKDDQEFDKDNALKWAEAIKDFVDAFKYLIMVLILIAIIYTLAKYKPWMYLPQFRNQRYSEPDEVLGINLKQDSLKPSTLQEIEALLQQRELRKALSLMLQYHLLRAVKRYRVPFKKSSTESECVVLMAAHCTTYEASSFSQLVQYWQQLAYAHDPLNHTELNQFFNNWQQLMQNEDQA